MANERVAIQETYQIPGFSLYKNLNLEKQFTLRAMTTMEERLRLSSQGLDTIAKIIRNCLTTNPDLDIMDLKLFDIQYLMYKLRIVTYGSDYPISIRCPYCGKKMDLHINLDELEVISVPDDFEEPIKIGPLPVSGDVISCKIQTLRDYLDIVAEHDKFVEKFPDGEDPTFFLDLENKIVDINGKQLPPFELDHFAKTLHARDYQYLEREYSKATNSFGISTIIEGTCEHCHKTFQKELPKTDEFFRPSY